MSKFVLIDNEQLQFLKVTPTLEQAEYWAEILIPKSDYQVVGVENKHYSVYTEYELRILYFHTDGEMPPENMEYNKLLKGVVFLADQIDIDDTPVWELKGKLGHDLPTPDVTPAPEKPTRTKSTGGGGKAPNRPKAGTATGRVWEIADECYQANGDAIPDRAEVIKKATDEGINQATVSTQFGKWKRNKLES